ncbi:MAG: flagellar basal body P-ring formation protein FlgA [Aquabacterium sp.]|nr:flagellar basal body P-ring formation protein FlgA [Aquabacterium sp.]
MKTSIDRSALLRQGIGLAPIQFLLAALSALLWAALCGLAALFSPAARAQTMAMADTNGLQSQVSALLKQQALPQGSGFDAASQKKAWRVEVVLGQLDPRLKLAPCDKVHAYMPDGVQLWGKTRVGLRCEQGAVRWNVFWPVTVKVWGQALVASAPLRAGMPVGEGDVRLAEVDLADKTSPAVTRPADIVGRTLVRGIEAGQSIRADDVKARRWFAAGDPVRLTVRGNGFQIAAEGTAMSPGDEGQCARVRTDNGRVVCGQPVGERLVELSL